MKFLVLALCVCAANAASFGYQQYRKPYQASAQAVIRPVAGAQPEAYVSAVVAPKAVYNAPQFVTAAPAVVSKAIYTAGKDAEAAILRSESDVNAEGFSYSYETNNGISSQVSGILKNIDNKEAIVSQGSFQYTAPDGTPVQLSFVADENGYQPRSDILPVAPPTPVAILNALEYIRTHPQKPENY